MKAVTTQQIRELDQRTITPAGTARGGTYGAGGLCHRAALMKDQVDQLHALQLPVSSSTSTLSTVEQNDRLDRMAAGEFFELVYVVPEQFRGAGDFLDAVRTRGRQSAGGQRGPLHQRVGSRFPPRLARLGHFRRLLGNPTTIALAKARRNLYPQVAA